jgi:hypothetical protein
MISLCPATEIDCCGKELDLVFGLPIVKLSYLVLKLSSGLRLNLLVTEI